MRITNIESLVSHGNVEGRKIVADLLDHGLDAINPYTRMKQLITREGEILTLNTQGYEMKEDPHRGNIRLDLSQYDRVLLIGAAKGVQTAALALEEILGDRLTGGHVIDKHGASIVMKRTGVTLAGHPVPDECCVEGCKAIEKLLGKPGKKDLIFTITGSGCSSLMTYPSEGIAVSEVAELTRICQIEKGMPTSQLNMVRTHLDRFKGGRLARLVSGATVINIVTADPAKMGTPIFRASYFQMLKKNCFFPTVACSSTFGDAVNVLKKWNVWNRISEHIRQRLLNGQDENLSIEEYESFDMRFLGLIFKDETLYKAVRMRASELGIRCVMLSEHMEAEAKEAGKVNAELALCAERSGEPFKPPIVLMTSGENVVSVGSDLNVVGGRNQEYCLSAALMIAGSDHIVFGAVDTDGTDGPGGLRIPDAPECLAGAIIDGYTVDEARKAGIDLGEVLRKHDTSECLWRLNSGVAATPNVSALDLGIILIT